MAGVALDLEAVVEKVDGGPIARAVEALPLAERHLVRILDIGDELGGLGGDQRLEFLLYLSRGRFQPGEPGKWERW